MFHTIKGNNCNKQEMRAKNRKIEINASDLINCTFKQNW